MHLPSNSGAIQFFDTFLQRRSLQVSSLDTVKMEPVEESNACLQLDAKDTKPKKATTQQWIMTGVVYYCNLVLGISTAFLAPAMLSFAAEYQTDMKSMAIIITIGRYVALGSTLLFGYIYGILNRHAVVVGLIFTLSAVLFFMPYGGSLIVFGILFATLNAAMGGYNTAQSIWIIDIWEEKAGPFIQGQHFLFAVGCIIPPVAFTPFLKKAKAPQNGTQLVDHMAGVYVPSLICGFACAIGGVLMLVTCLLYRKREKKSEIAAKTNSAEVPESTPTSLRKVVVVACSSLILGGTASMEININNYLPTYAHYSNFKFSEADGARVFSAFQIAFTVSRLAAIFVVMKVNPKVILVFNFVLVAAANVLLIVTSPSGSSNLLYVGSVLLGIGFSTTFPTTFAYLQSHLEFTSIIASVLLVAGNSLASFTPLIVGGYIETFADVITWLNLGTDAIGAIAFAIIVVAVRGVKGKL